jgi:hypothetical protein
VARRVSALLFVLASAIATFALSTFACVPRAFAADEEAADSPPAVKVVQESRA